MLISFLSAGDWGSNCLLRSMHLWGRVAIDHINLKFIYYRTSGGEVFSLREYFLRECFPEQSWETKQASLETHVFLESHSAHVPPLRLNCLNEKQNKKPSKPSPKTPRYPKGWSCVLWWDGVPLKLQTIQPNSLLTTHTCKRATCCFLWASVSNLYANLFVLCHSQCLYVGDTGTRPCPHIWMSGWGKQGGTFLLLVCLCQDIGLVHGFLILMRLELSPDLVIAVNSDDFPFLRIFYFL